MYRTDYIAAESQVEQLERDLSEAKHLAKELRKTDSIYNNKMVVKDPEPITLESLNFVLPLIVSIPLVYILLYIFLRIGASGL